MKYWIITKEYPPAYGGGIGTYCFHTANMLKEQGWDVSVFLAGRTGGNDSVKQVNGVRIIEFPLNKSRAWNLMGFDAALAFEFAEVIGRYLKEEGVPDVLESQEYAGIAYYILQHKHLNYPLFRDLKVLLTLHAPSFLYNDYNRVPGYQLPYFWTGEMERWCMQAADMVHSPSNFMAEAVIPYFTYSPLRNKVHIVPYPFKVTPVQSNYDHDPRENWFFFGKLTPQKGILPLLKAFRNLVNGGWNKKLQLIGGGDHFYHAENISINEWIKRKYKKELRHDQLVMLGNLAPAEWNKITGNGAVMLVPSIGDNYPFTVLESMNNGQVVLASMQGGQSELVEDGKNGFLFDHNKPQDLENKFLEISALPAEKIKEVRMNAAIAVNAKHSYEKVFAVKKELIQQLIQGYRQPARFPYIRNIDPAMPHPFADPTEQKTLLSIVVPYYNMGAYIEETITSIFNSTYGNREIIVVNDGSTEASSIQIIKDLQKKYGFTLLEQENKGLSEARNAGARLARGEYLAFIDADDKIDPGFYSKAIQLLEEKINVSYVGSWVQYFENSKAIWVAFNPEPPYILYYNTVCSGGLLFRRSHFMQGGLNDPKMEYGLEDWESIVRMTSQGFRGVVIPEIMYHYRIRKSSMARSLTTEKILYSVDYINKKHLEFYSTFAADINGLLHANGPGFKINNPTLDYKRYGSLTQKYPGVRKMIDFVKRNPFLRKIIFKIYAIIKK